MYTSPSVLQFARTVTVGLSRKTGWPDRAWWSQSSTTTTSLTNFTSLGVMRPENRGEIVSVYNLQWVARIPPGRLQSNVAYRFLLILSLSKDAHTSHRWFDRLTMSG